jgi:hypothetical protein
VQSHPDGKLGELAHSHALGNTFMSEGPFHDKQSLRA